MLASGQIISHYGDGLTPYAEAIISQYVNVVPFYLNVPTGLQGDTDEHTVVVTQPWKYDVLILGAYVDGCIVGASDDTVITEDGDTVITEDGDTVITESGSDVEGSCYGQQIFMQVADQRSLLSWATAAPIDSAPMSAFGGSDGNVMPILKLPEAFFLPKNVQLRHDFYTFSNQATGGSVNWVGLQLINPKGQSSPQSIKMPDGKSAVVGSRLPWMAVIGVGRETIASGNLRYRLAAGARLLAYTQPAEYDVEIHDIHCQFFESYQMDGGNINDIQFALSDTGNRRFWTRDYSPAPALMGDTTKVYPGLPLPKPYLLKKGDQIELTIINNGDDADIVLTNAYVVLRGVKLCES